MVTGIEALLKEINQATKESVLDEATRRQYIKRYQAILAKGDVECPPPDKKSRKKGQRGRLKRTKSRALLERLIEFQYDVLRFMVGESVPFTNNQGENDIRMTKVHQKISGCFRSMNGAQIFCLLRSYISSCRKQQVTASHALKLLFEKQLPDIFKNCEGE